MKEKDVVEKLEPFLNIDNWNEFVSTPTVKGDRGFTLKAVTQLLQRKCGLMVTKIMIKNALDLKFCADPMIVQASPSHGVAFYNNMIFDANNESPKTATKSNIDSYNNLPCSKRKKTLKVNRRHKSLEPKAKQLNVLAYKCFRAPAAKKKQPKKTCSPASGTMNTQIL